MTLVIPVSDFASYSEQITLDGQVFLFQFDLNVRGDYWVLQISDIDLNVLISGVRIVLDYELLSQYPGRGLPPGALIAIDTTGEELDANKDNFGPVDTNVSLIYIPVSEAEEVVS